MATHHAAKDADEPNFIQQIVRDVTAEIRHEIHLAKDEMAEKAKSAGIGAGMMSASAVTGLLTLACVTALVAVLLSSVLPSWGAVLIVTVIWGIVTACLALLGKKKVEDATPFVPERAIDDVKRDVARVRRRTSH